MTGTNIQPVFLGQVDLTKRPKLYRTNNPDYAGEICIDLYPTTLPTIASFKTLPDAVNWLREKFGDAQMKVWFPDYTTE